MDIKKKFDFFLSRLLFACCINESWLKFNFKFNFMNMFKRNMSYFPRISIILNKNLWSTFKWQRQFIIVRYVIALNAKWNSLSRASKAWTYGLKFNKSVVSCLKNSIGRPRECSNPAQKVKQLFRRDVFYTPVLGYRRVPGVTGQRADDKEADVGQTIAPLFYQ